MGGKYTLPSERILIMSFSGDLEHLPIVDVIQLLHSTRKTGTLCLKGPKGESQLVFNDGYFVSANHHSNKFRIGQILVASGAITAEQLDESLKLQKNSSGERKPLLAILIEQGIIDRDDAYKGLESLIEMTIVEVLTWTSGTFSLDVSKVDVSDEYRYFPETLKEEIYLNAQSILMDALRIYDEKMRDGTLADLFFNHDSEEHQEPPREAVAPAAITADLLGLDELDMIDRKIPDVFKGLQDHDPTGEHRSYLELHVPALPPDKIAALSQHLAALSRHERPESSRGPILPGTAPAVLVFSPSPLLRHVIATACRADGIFVVTTDQTGGMDMIIEQSICRDSVPVLIVDATSCFNDPEESVRMIQLVQDKRRAYPSLTILPLVPPPGLAGLSLPMLEAGVRAVLPMPLLEPTAEISTEGLINALEVLRGYLTTSFSALERQSIRRFSESTASMGRLAEPPDVALELLRFAASIFDRALTFVVGKNELIAEKGIGIKGGTIETPTPPLMFKIPLDVHSIFRDITEKKRFHYGLSSDPLLSSCIYRETGAPHNGRFMLAPLVCFGKTIALVYGDFGQAACRPVPTELMDSLARHAGHLLERASLRKRFEQPFKQA